VYKKAVALAEAAPDLDYGGKTGEEKAAVLLQKHEGSVLFVYPDRHGNPTVGVGFNLNLALNPDAKQTIDDLFGAGTYDKMMASYQRTMDQWKLEHHDRIDGFEYGTAAWKKFFKEHGGTSDKSLSMASGSDGDILTNVLTGPDATTGDPGTSAKLLETVLPDYVSNARSLVGASVWDNNLDQSEQAALIDIVYNRGYTNTKNEFGGVITALQNGDDIAAAVALMDAKLSTGKSKGKVWATLDPSRAIDDFRYLVWGDESKLK
jgi:GH24 family phage-related lysozyme (muramidase)